MISRRVPKVHYLYDQQRDIKTHNFEEEFITASSSQYKLPPKIAQLPSSWTRLVLRALTVKWHKTEECILIYHFNFIDFAFFFSRIFFLWSRPSQTIPRPGRVNRFLFLRHDFSFFDVFRVLGFSMFNLFFSFSIGEAGFKMLIL